MKHVHGSIEVITGSMFSGKTEELIRRLRRARIARQNVQVFKPIIDNRYTLEKVKSHAGHEFEATPVGGAADILPQVKPDTTVVAIDEAQFFDRQVCETSRLLAERGEPRGARRDRDRAMLRGRVGGRASACEGEKRQERHP